MPACLSGRKGARKQSTPRSLTLAPPWLGLVWCRRKKRPTSPATVPPSGSVEPWRTSLAFLICYTLASGSAVHVTDTAAGALLAYSELQDIGAGAMTIRNERGRTISVEE